MKRFNSMAALRKLDNINNSKTKKRTIIACVVVLVIGILYFSFARFESTQTFNLISGTVNINDKTLIDKLFDLKAKGTTELEYDGTQTLGENGTEDNNLRYVGANPSNYVEFNGELWRIIGLMNNIEKDDGTIDSLVKIIRAESIGGYSWDTSDSSINNGDGINQWGESGNYEGADLMRELNTDYLGNVTVGTDGNWYNGSNNYKKKPMPISTLNSDVQNLIQGVKWSTGSDGNSDVSMRTTKNMYTYERSDNVAKMCSDEKTCNDSVERTTSWIGKVALIYPSDYGYSTSGGSIKNKEICLNTTLHNWKNISDCKNNSWLNPSGSFLWTLTPHASSSAFHVFGLSSDSVVPSVYGDIADTSNKVFPVIFLKSSIYVTGGNGSSDKPYKLEYKPNITDTLASLKSNGSIDLEYDGEETLGVNGTEDNNLRYVGATPNNYVYFNCDTTNTSEMNDSTCEKWRIIGLFNNIEDNNGNVSSRVKIIRDQSLGSYSWDTSDSSINNGWGINQWELSDPYEGADLMRELNTDYLGNITVGTDSKWYNGSNNSKTANMPSKMLNSNAQDMIQEVQWNTGTNGNNETSKWTTKNMYTYERSNNTGKICSSGTSCNDSVERSISWVGKVALMYPSDYGYATVGGTTTNKETCLNTTLYDWDGSGVSDCKNNSWLKPSSYQWTLSPRAYANIAYHGFIVRSDGIVCYHNVSDTAAVRPAVFLRSSITIAEGNGSLQTPYKLTM